MDLDLTLLDDIGGISSALVVTQKTASKVSSETHWLSGLL